MPDTNDTRLFSDGASGDGMSPARPMGAAMRVLCHIAAVNHERLAKCPLDDWQATVRTAFALIVSYLFIATSVTGALAIAFGWRGAQIAMALPIAGVVTFAVVLLDHAIIQAHWFQTGASQARARGFMPDGPRGPGMLRGLAAGAFRFALSGALAFVVAGFVQLQVFSHDIHRQMNETHRARNATVFAQTERRADDAIAVRETEIAAMARQHAAALAQYDDAARETAATIRARSAASDTRIAQLREARDAQQAEAQSQRNHAVFEEHGTAGANYQSRGAGKDVRYKTAIALAEQAEARARDLRAEIDTLQAASPNAGAPDLGAARQEIDRMRARRDALSAERDAMAAARATVVLNTATADPAYVPMPEGLFAEWIALDQLTREPAAWIRAAGINALMMLVELTGLLVRMLVVSPSLYAVRTATVFEVDAAASIAWAEPAIAGSAETAGEAQERRETMHDERTQHRDRRRNRARVRKKFDVLF